MFYSLVSIQRYYRMQFHEMSYVQEQEQEVPT